MSRVKNFLFGTENLLRQAYVQFFVAVIGAPFSFFLPQRIQIVLIAMLSWWAIIISAQTFIAASKANRSAENINDKEI